MQPGFDAACEVGGWPSRTGERLGSDRRTDSHVTDHDDGRIERQLARPFPELAEGDVVRTGEGPFGHLLGLTDVEDEDAFAGVEPGTQLVRSDVGTHGCSGSSPQVGGHADGHFHGHPGTGAHVVRSISMHTPSIWSPPIDGRARTRWYARGVGSTRDLLHDDEELLAEVRPHPVVVIGPVVLFLVAVAGAATIAIRYPNAPVVVAWLLAAMIVLPASWVLVRWLRWRSVRFLVTTTRLLYRRGVIGRDVIQLRLQRIAEVHCSQSLGGRLIGCGRLVFEVAGGDGPLVVEDVRRPRRVQRVITSQLDRFAFPYGSYGGYDTYGAYNGAPTPRAQSALRVGGASPDATGSTGRRGQRGGRSRPWTDTPPHGVLLGDAADGTIPVQILQLDELRRRGILTEDEFAAKKAELLGRL